MRDNCILTAESVTEGHPDKLCDTIADAILDACLTGDPDSRVAGEVLATAGKITVAGEITSKSMPDIPHIVCKTVRQIGYSGNYEVEVDIHDQSPDIADAVNNGNGITAGDQGIVYGYACRETKELLPLPVVLAHRITKGLTDARRNGVIPDLRPDGKAQVSVEYEHGKPKRVHTVVVSTQHEPGIRQQTLRDAIHEHILLPALGGFLDPDTEILINPSGSFVLGGFEADTGLTGRKLMVDTYGGLVPHGGGVYHKRQGLHQSGSQRGIYGPVSCQEHRGGWSGREMHCQFVLCHRQGGAAVCAGGYPWYRNLSGRCVGKCNPDDL